MVQLKSQKRYWTHYWTQPTLEAHREQSGVELRHTSGNQFLNCGVSIGDVVYCVSTVEGSVILIGRVKFDRHVSQAEADKDFDQPVQQATDHLVANPGNGSPLHLDRIVPMKEVRKLRFNTQNGETTVKFRGDRIDQQTLRRVRELTEGSALLFDKIIEQTDGD